MLTLIALVVGFIAGKIASYRGRKPVGGAVMRKPKKVRLVLTIGPPSENACLRIRQRVRSECLMDEWKFVEGVTDPYPLPCG